MKIPCKIGFVWTEVEWANESFCCDGELDRNNALMENSTFLKNFSSDCVFKAVSRN